MKFQFIIRFSIIIASLICSWTCNIDFDDPLKTDFKNPPADARPGVYWYFMDGNLNEEEMTKDLESMKSVGIGSVLFLEVNVGVPRGKIDFLSDEWIDLITHGIKETERLGMEFILGSGPGWAGSGGPWVEPKLSMRHLVGSTVELSGPGEFDEQLPTPAPRTPFFGERTLTEALKEQWNGYYEDVAVLAFPTPTDNKRIDDIDEKALYYRAPYTSAKNVKPFLLSFADYADHAGANIPPDEIIDLTEKLQKDGSLKWNIPDGNWTIVRLGMRNNGAVTRPAPMPGLGFEADKFDTLALNDHCGNYLRKIINNLPDRSIGGSQGWTTIHIDSWEMGAQNWTDSFRESFMKSRGYDPLKYLPTYLGYIVDDLETSERFLWDIRQTSMELVLKNHAGHFKELGRRHGFIYSNEPYDMNPASDLDLGMVADIPMGEFWTKGYGFNSSFSCIEATSIAHVNGRRIVGAEAFTADNDEGWKMYPGNVKNQGDWAFCMGINKIIYHTFAHKPLGDQFRPGMTMGPYGVHWDRGQTWWDLSLPYHTYIARCQNMLRQGRNVADILYLTPEGAPHVFRPPLSALSGNDTIPDKRGYSFDGCSPLALIQLADVESGDIVFPGGARYKILILPYWETMTPELIEKIEYLIENGATMIGGRPPLKSPSLTNFPGCDEVVSELAKKIWGDTETPPGPVTREYGKGKIYWGGLFSTVDEAGLYPEYEVVANVLTETGIIEDFTCSIPEALRYTHRTLIDKDIYFISNKSGQLFEGVCHFRQITGYPELWDPVTGNIRQLPQFEINNGSVSIPIVLEKDQSFFIVFPKTGKSESKTISTDQLNFAEHKKIHEIEGPWNVYFDTVWGGPGNVIWNELEDWSQSSDLGIKFFSGRVVYYTEFDLPEANQENYDKELYIELGEFKNIAKVTLNGNDIGIIWTYPHRLNISEYVSEKGNKLEIEIRNLWPNRLIGDSKLPYDGIQNGNWPEWLLEDKERSSGRFTFTTHNFYEKNEDLQKSGLLGPVSLSTTL